VIEPSDVYRISSPWLEFWAEREQKN